MGLSKTRELVFVCLNPSPTPCPIEEPSCKEGPSGPKKSPVPITKIPPINLRHRIGNHFTDSVPCNSSYHSFPLPLYWHLILLGLLLGILGHIYKLGLNQ